MAIDDWGDEVDSVHGTFECQEHRVAPPVEDLSAFDAFEPPEVLELRDEWEADDDDAAYELWRELQWDR